MSCRICLLDTGTGIRSADAPPRRPSLPGHPPGHLHSDDTNGLPFFGGTDGADARVDVYIPEQDGTVESTLATFMAPPDFPITPGDLHGTWRFLHLAEGLHRIEGYELMAREVPHKGGRTFGYRVSDGTVTIAYMSDHHPASLGPGPEGYGPYHETAVALANTCRRSAGNLEDGTLVTVFAYGLRPIGLQTERENGRRPGCH